MKRVLFILLMVCIAGLSAYAQRFALIDMEYIMSNIPAYKTATSQLEASSKQWQAEIDKATEEAKKMYDDYQATAAKLSDAQRTQKEEAIVAKEKAVAELRRQYFGPEGELYKQQQELMGPLQDAIYNAVKAIATQQGYDVVADRASASSIIFASPAIDISDEVLAKMGYSN